jgi:thiol-disulfide isomerase/thioredoxin
VAKTPPAKKSTSSKTPVKAAKGRPAGLFTWIAVALVVVVVATLVIIKVTGGSSTPSATAWQQANPVVVANLTGVPNTVFDTVGVNSTVVPVTPPQEIKNQPPLTGTSATGTTLPVVLYVGAEYCPYCAAQRWATIIALSRFGTWAGLGNMSSYSGDVYGGTPTFTFVKATYKSKYLLFRSVEEYTNYIDPTTNYYKALQQLTGVDQAIFKKYDTSKWINGLTAANDYSIPFISMGNRWFVSGASFSPGALASLSRDAIAQGLKDPTSPVTAAIIASANYQTAALCTLTNEQPGNVCTSSGVMAAKRAMGIK